MLRTGDTVGFFDLGTLVNVADGGTLLGSTSCSQQPP